MSGFFGMFKPGGGSIDLDQFDQTKKAMHRDGNDGMETYVDDHIAVGHIMLRVGNASEYDKQPLKSDCGNYVLVGHFRLDYRDELGDKLGLTQNELEITPDSKLAMLAYLKWKDKCVYHIEGDWAFLVYDKISNLAFASKDRGGFSAFFYRFFEGSFYFSSTPKFFEASFFGPVQLNENYFCSLLFLEFAPLDGMTLDMTVSFLSLGTYLQFNSNGSYFIKKYYSVPQIGLLNYKYDYDYLLDFSSSFIAAVKSRMVNSDSLNGIFLSGGLDSGSIAGFLSKLLLKTDFKLVSYTSFPKHITLIPEVKRIESDERASVKVLGEYLSNLEFNFVSFDDTFISDFFQHDIDAGVYYPVLNNNTFWIQGILRNFKDQGVRRVYNGQIGNYTLSWFPYNYNLNLLLSLRLSEFYKQVRYVAYELEIKLSEVLKRILLSFIRWNLRSTLSLIVGQKMKRFRRSIYYSKNKSFQLSLFKKTFNIKTYLTFDSKANRLHYYRKLKNFSGMIWYINSENSCLESCDPSADDRFELTSFSIPEKYFYFRGKAKYILLKSIAGLIPNLIYETPFSYKQSFDIAYRIKEDPLINKMVEEIIQINNKRKVFDLNHFLDDYQKIKNANFRVGEIGLSLKFLRQLSVIWYFYKKH